jgi:hypothetical protein
VQAIDGSPVVLLLSTRPASAWPFSTDSESQEMRRRFLVAGVEELASAVLRGDAASDGYSYCLVLQGDEAMVRGIAEDVWRRHAWFRIPEAGAAVLRQ